MIKTKGGMSEYRFIDLFAGAGGFSLGFSMSGFNLDLALEQDRWAVDTLKENHSEATIIEGDIRDVEIDLKYKGPDVIIGGPPCQGFSVAGPTKDPNDPRNTLFVYFAKWVEKLEPTFFVMENVAGILTKKNADNVKISDIIIQTFDKLGYEVSVWKINAADYGVPQSRERVFFVGSKDGLCIPPPSPTHNYSSKIVKEENELKVPVTIGEAILDLPYIEARQGEEQQPYTLDPSSEFQIWARKDSTHVHNHVAMKHTQRLVDRYLSIQGGINLESMPEELKVRQRNGKGELSKAEYNSNYRHLLPNAVSYTIPASFYSSFIHPHAPRNLTAREAARIQSFPDTYIFKGKRTQISKKLLAKLGKEHEDFLSQYNQIGNAVPPLLSKAIADHLKKFLKQKKTS
ncbi:MAG: DNA cytosine methyltransferase [Crocinitomicaceae bacterium]|nr:DNA cytosine methyltransferase [Crocinitomicaceae bacterium]